MSDFTIKVPVSVPSSEYSTEFIQGMVDRMGMSFFKYGKVVDAYPDKVSALGSLRERLANYRQDGNTEWLIDVANFAMIEAMCPSHENAHFEATDSTDSPGRSVTQGGRYATNEGLNRG